MVTSPWPDVGDELKAFYEKKFLLHQGWEHDDFLDAFIPRQGEFFGTKVLNIFIASKPYGWTQIAPDSWTFDWQVPGSAYSLKVLDFVAKWDEYRVRFPQIKTLVYGDKSIAAQVAAECPGSDIMEMMDKTIVRLQQFCLNTANFEYVETLESPVPAAYFQPRIDEFYGTPEYQR